MTNTTSKIMNIPRAITKIEKNIMLGFSDETYLKINGLMKILSHCLDPYDLGVLKEFWRDSYTDSCDHVILDTVCKQLKLKYKNQSVKF